MNKLLLESFEGDVIISRAHSEDGNEIAIRTKRRDGSGDDYYFITLQEMRKLVENFTAFDAELARCWHLIPDPIIGKPTPAYELGHKFCPKCGEKL